MADSSKDAAARSREHWPMFLVLGLGLALRLGCVWSMRGHPLFEPLLPGYDMTVFHEWARRIATGELLPDKPFYQAPLYPYLLGAIYAVAGPSVAAAAAAQALMGAVSLWLVYLLGRRLFGSRAAGLWAASLMAATPVFLFYECFLLRATLATLLNLAFLWSLAAYEGLRPRAGAALSGALLGLAALARANVLVMLPVGLVWLWRKSRKQGLKSKALAPALFLSAALLVISPATIHNRLSGGSWTLVSTNAAENWRIGNSYDSTGGFCYPEKGMVPVISGDFLKLQLKKLVMLLSDYEEPNNLNFYLLRRDNRFFRIPLLSWAFYLAFGLAGLLLSLDRRRQLFPLYGYLVLYGLAVSAFFVASRFRVPLWPALILFSGYAFSRIVQAVHQGQLRFAAAVLAAPLVLYLAMAQAAPRTIQPRYFDNMVLLYRKLGDTPGEIRALRDKLAYYPDDPAAALVMAHYLQSEGRAAEALEMAERVLALHPNLPAALRAAGFLELELGSRRRAAGLLGRYLELNPLDPDSALIRSIIAGERLR